MYFYYSLGNADGAVVQVYAPDASGTAAPIRTITLPYIKVYSYTGYNYYYIENARIQVSAAGDIYALALCEKCGVEDATAVLHYSPGANGTVTPIAQFNSHPDGINVGAGGVIFTLH
jgi:hypothetical protein